ncbi:15-hydroxyprostaglandin dehydrogenase [NAD(+)]-like [Gigantopelta aegis]|uniref:15-hydroxyprostaglandin dehydrogenase [NAD(+)]-like n=1 Tax=Gigantopelta aegis TaxID=1735272 RepID=UPI001B88E066|nr:15-hydroxyprostaglandin dehydrogenase [NAD(+)]-like [Gigantopelta aegis]
MDISGKAFFITGAAQGIGRAYAEAVLNKGGNVFIADVNSAVGEKTTADIQTKHGADRVRFGKLDIRDKDQFSAVFKSAVTIFGQIDVMVNNAGIAHERHWEKTIAINFNGTVNGTYLAMDHMRKDKGGKGGVILCTNSISGLSPSPPIPVYSGTKFAIKAFINCWAASRKNSAMGIRFASLCPSATETPINEFEPGQIVDEESLLAMHAEVGYLKVSDVADAMIKLAEDENSNGKAMFVTAGKEPFYISEILDPPIWKYQNL